MTENYISVQFEDEKELLATIKLVKEAEIKIFDVFTPFHVHGLDKALGLKKSLIPTVGFICGSFGALTGFLLQTWIFVDAWPLNIGGKPFFAVPSFIPVTFELTVLFAVFGMIGAFLYKSKLYPGSKNKIYHNKITDDSFVMIIDSEAIITEERKYEMEQLLYEGGAYNVDFINEDRKS